MNRPFVAALAGALLVAGVAGRLFDASAQVPPPGTLLTGTVTSASGEKMEGVTVSARGLGTTITTSVFTDAEGKYYFPLLAEGEYRVWAQAVAFEAARSDLALGGSLVAWNATLLPKKDFELQLPGDRWLDALPEDTPENRKMKEVYRLACNGCHTHGFTLATRFDEKGWNDILTVMGVISPYGYTFPANAGPGSAREPSPIIGRYQKDLARWLARMRGPGPSPMKFSPRPRPRGDATLMVVREYDVPEPGTGLPLFHDGSDWSLGPVDFMDAAHMHAMEATLDLNGDLWMTDFFNTEQRTAAKIDWKTGQVTNIPVTAARRRNGALAGGHDIETNEEDGTIWFNLTGSGLLAKVTPATRTVEALKPTTTKQVGDWITLDPHGGVWAQSPGGAVHFDPRTGTWTEYTDPPVEGRNLSTYGIAADADGNGWTSNYVTDGYFVHDRKTGETAHLPLPKRKNPAEALFTEEEQRFFNSIEQEFRARGRLNGQAVRKPGGDLRTNVVWGPTWHGDALLKLDVRTRKFTSYPYPLPHANGYHARVDKDGMVWVVFTNEDMVGKFDPKTARWTTYDLPTRGFRSHGLQPVTVNGRTEVAIAYLGASKVAKLQFRTRDEHRGLKREAERRQRR